MLYKNLLTILTVFFIVMLESCATYTTQYKNIEAFVDDSSKEKEHTFFLLGDGGNAPEGGSLSTLLNLQKRLQKANENSTLIFLGDNLYPEGMPDKNSENRKLAEHRLDVQMDLADDFKGTTFFIPGNHDWYDNGLKGLERQEKYITKRLGKDAYLPSGGCPLKKVDISDDIVVIVIDSEWYLTNWDKHPTMNDRCPIIKTRDKFFEEVRGLIKKNAEKTTLIAVHHPMMSNGPHGGQFSLKQQLYPFGNKVPLPVIGSLANLVRKTGGISSQDLQNKRYNEFRQRLMTLAQESDNIIFVSGHEHNLQYLVEGNKPQIISGSGSKENPARAIGAGKFSHGGLGYAELIVYKDGSSEVKFYAIENEKEKLVFETNVLQAKENYEPKEFQPYPDEMKSSIYTKEETKKSGLYKTLLGKHHRELFSKEITAPTVNLDTLYGGLTPVRRGGGNQSRSLRLVDKEGREYVMRALRKSATQYLQAVLFKDIYLKNDLKNTTASNVLQDAFTSAYPYAPFTIPTLSEAIGVYYTNPKLFYIPKQKALQQYNEDYGDELYMIEERAANGREDVASFGYAKKIISTDDLLKKIRKDEEYTVDEKKYIRARLFDMLIGDWDRHEDQWRWAEFDDQGGKRYIPVPRDRDQAFSKYDGLLLGISRKLLPMASLLQVYDEDLKNVKWMNVEPYPLDVALLDHLELEDWLKQAEYIQTHLDAEIFEKAFQNVPKEMDQETIQDIQHKFLERKKRLKDIAKTYFKVVNKYAIVKGTDKDDIFDIVRLPEGKTEVTAYRNKKGKRGEKIHHRVYDRKNTKEIWVYGLDDEDRFEIKGKGNRPIKIRVIGGQNHDEYTVENSKKIKVYDFKSKKNTITSNQHVAQRLTNDYETNLYNYKKPKYNSNRFMPAIGANPDDGFRIGFKDVYTINGFERNPFTQQHTFSAQYYFETNGFDLGYQFEQANVIGNWNFVLDTHYASPNYSINYFGFGNETAYDEDTVDDDYNRVKISAFYAKPALKWRGQTGGSFDIITGYETYKVDETEGRYITQVMPTETFERDQFVGVEARYTFENYDRPTLPTLGMKFQLSSAWKQNLENSNSIGIIKPEISFDYKIVPSGRLVLATKLDGRILIGDDYEFYQASSIGANNGLRGFRNQRFTGKHSFYQSSDLRWTIASAKTAVIPISWGILGGFDYGRVWADDVEDSDKWHNSYGGGLYINAAQVMTGKITYFQSDDGSRIAFGVGFGF
ncbi:hypothetical protein UJ101_00679 [Flavobacteriaceae bacterium UJ101]|nr:hypothetical protein UJ101_00679 [Flavobacteriaceae bacterium UJ101]